MASSSDAVTNRPPLARNPISIAGAWLTTVAAFAFIAYYAAEYFALLENPYSGIFGFVLVPAAFVAGLLLIPLGIWREARRRRRGETAWRWPAIDLGRSRTRQVLFGVFVLTLVNLAIVGVAGVGALHYMERDQFCGQVCHEPMRPEYTAHLQAPHASVGCVDCHVSPGAAGTVRAKVNGARQAYEYMLGTFARPIASPARNIPAAADTCVQCHTAGHPTRDIAIVKHDYADDEANTDTVTSLVMLTSAIHWHARPDVRVEYAATDGSRETIPYVKVTAADGQVTEYLAPGAVAPSGPLRRMDCIDCHSRPAHSMSTTAERAVDRAIAAGEISAARPFVKRESVAALKTEYANETAAIEGIRRRLTDFYRDKPAAATDQVSAAVASLQRLYRFNVFPEMKITWATYRSQLGHGDVPGCFRCHDDEHKTATGKVIAQECERCHKVQ